MDLSKISLYRSHLMGIAMLMVVFHHLPVEINNPIFHYIKQNAGFGVDVFLLLSGMGLYFSMSKDGSTLKQYYVNRMIRIFPIYVLVIAGVMIVTGTFDWIKFFLQVTTIGWWTTGVCYDWFIPTIVLLYLLFPLFYCNVLKHKGLRTVLGGVIVVVLMYVAFLLLFSYGSNFQMWLRFPVFFLGAVVGKLIKEYETFCSSCYMIGGLFAMFVFGVILSVYAFCEFNPPCAITEISEVKKTGWLFVPYIFMVPFFCMLWCILFEVSILKFLLVPVKSVGVMSIELYLLHGQFIYLTRFLTNEYSLSKPLLGAVLVSFSFVASWQLHKLNVWMMDKMKVISLR